MNKRLETLLERLPKQFPVEPHNNNYKLLSIIAENGVENEKTQQMILKFWDVDQAEGIGLDRLGRDEGISRGSWNDEDYRKMIKIQCIVNLSESDIDTMNLILDAYLGNSFIGLEEGWVNYDKSATLVVMSKLDGKPYSFDLVHKIKAAGVGILHKMFINPDSTKMRVASLTRTGISMHIQPYKQTHHKTIQTIKYGFYSHHNIVLKVLPKFAVDVDATLTTHIATAQSDVETITIQSEED